MTGIAQGRGAADKPDAEAALSWEWEIRSVNSRGLDLRLRLPEGMILLEKLLRDRVAATISRGAVTVNLRLTHAPRSGAGVIDETALGDCLDALARISELAAVRGFSLCDFSALDLLSQRGISTGGHDRATFAPETLVPLLAQHFDQIVADLDAMRAAEGDELRRILAAQIEGIAELTAQARDCLEGRADAVSENLSRALARIAEPGSIDEGRIAQELALLAVKGDVSEELDRLAAHCVAARGLLDLQGPVGRKLDFLTQEFAREANTLCAKAQYQTLTRIGLDLKSVIDQMREQVQNVE